MKMTRRDFLKLMGGMAVAGTVAAATGYTYASLIEPGRIAYEQHSVPLPGLHPSLEGFRLVHLSDFHYNLAQDDLSHVQAVVTYSNTLQPDLVVLTGDFVDNDLDGLDVIAETLGELQGRYGCYAVLGNHDHKQGASKVRRALEKGGITVLWNENVTLTGDAAALSLVGIDDWLRGRPQVSSALDGLPRTTTTIALMHEPDVADVLCRYPQIQLQLSGHSHGGQIRLPGIGPLILPSLGHKYHQGLYQIEHLWLYTTRGVGTLSNVPLRFNCPPELTELVLVRG